PGADYSPLGRAPGPFGEAAYLYRPMTPAISIPEDVQRALAWLSARQREDGSWEGEVVWCPMIVSQWVIARRILGRPIDERTRQGIIRHFEITRREGIGWGLHPESRPYVFLTALGYVAL